MRLLRNTYPEDLMGALPSQKLFPRATMRFEIYALLLVAVLMAPAQGQDPGNSANSPLSLPMLIFTLDFPHSDPEHYSIQVGSDGRSAYESTSKLSDDSEQVDSFHLDFTTSETTRKRIFDLAARARYFQSPVESKHRVASTGNKTLIFKDAQRSTQVTYNYSQLPAIQELTTLFQNMSQTLEFARRLQYDYRYQKLALDEELKRMEDMARANNLGEMQAVVPILNRIAADTAVINVVRARAQRLAAMAGGVPR